MKGESGHPVSSAAARTIPGVPGGFGGEMGGYPAIAIT